LYYDAKKSKKMDQKMRCEPLKVSKLSFFEKVTTIFFNEVKKRMQKLDLLYYFWIQKNQKKLIKRRDNSPRMLKKVKLQK